MVTTSSPISDMLIRVKNGYLAKNRDVVVPWSKIKEAIAKILVKQGYLESAEVKDHTLFLKTKKGSFTDVKIVSKPSLRVYVGKNDLPRVLGGLGFAIISTPFGLLTDKEARKKGLGGEVICEIW